MSILLNQLRNHLRRSKLVHQLYINKTNVSTLIKDDIFKKTVFISQSKDIYTNLALEDWLYKKRDFTNHHILLLWQSSPCVVIGRHQNPWLEANISNLNQITDEGVKLARRNSGGGTVYHDEGNLNLTFFSSRDCYDRKSNLEIISTALMNEYGLKVDISSRDDLTLNNVKVSGTAAKLARSNAYHHCTLLVDVNKRNLKKALQKPDMEIKTNATTSIPSTIMNLSDENKNIRIGQLIKIIGLEYLKTPVNSIKNGSARLVKEQNGFQMVNPTDGWFPGLTQIRNDLQSWEWCYGKTPKFTISKSFPIPENLLDHFWGSTRNLQVTISVENGKIDRVDLNIPPDLATSQLDDATKIIRNLKGCRFSEDTYKDLDRLVAYVDFVNDRDKFVTKCIQNVMNVL